MKVNNLRSRGTCITNRRFLWATLGLALFILSVSSTFASAYQLPRLPVQDLAPLPTLQYQNNVEDCTNKYVPKSNDNVQSRSFHRRRLFTAAISCVGCVSAGLLHDNVANAVEDFGNGIIRSKGCYQGTGDGCTELSENNPLIQQLQQQSIKNRERNEKEALYAYYMKNYPDFFNSIGQVLVKKMSDDSFVLMTPQEAERLQGLGKLTYEIPKTRGGTIVDLTQKPILVLNE